jgi:hypothetical protein
MKTDDLIHMLATNVEPTDRFRITRDLAVVVIIGVASAIIFVLLTTGFRVDLSTAQDLMLLLLKLAFASGVVAYGLIYLLRAARPGEDKDPPTSLWAATPVLATVLIAVSSLILAPTAHLRSMAMGTQWIECLISIPVIAIVPFAAVVWFLRRMAPTDLNRAGALTGLVAGGMSAIGYALHCGDDTLLFVVFWFGIAIALCTAAGAALGPKLLRW